MKVFTQKKTDVIYNLEHHGGGDLTSGQIMCEDCEDAEIRYSCEMLKDGDHVLDIGGNMGLHTVNFAKHIIPNGKLVAFEPMKKNFDVLCKNIVNHELDKKNVLALNVALSDKSKKSQYIINNRNMGDCRGHVFKGETFEEETVQEISLDDFFENLNSIDIEWGKIKLIKIDTQGSEVNILKGGSKCFENHFNGTIFMEYAPYWLNNNNQDMEWFWKFLKDQMFSIFSIPLDSNINGRPIVNPSSIEKLQDYYEECKEKDTYCNIILKKTPYNN